MYTVYSIYEEVVTGMAALNPSPIPLFHMEMSLVIYAHFLMNTTRV